MDDTHTSWWAPQNTEHYTLVGSCLCGVKLLQEAMYVWCKASSRS
jgi:hypothetical protein